jgi:hypothetical protein
VNHVHLELIDDGCLERYHLGLTSYKMTKKLSKKLVIHVLVWTSIHVPGLYCMM